MAGVPTAPAKAELRTENKEVIPLLFNPAELTITKAATWNAAESKGNNAPLLKFSAGQPGTLALSITLDTTDKGTSGRQGPARSTSSSMAGASARKARPRCEIAFLSSSLISAVVRSCPCGTKTGS